MLRALGGWINEAGRCWPTIRAVATASGLAPTSCARAIRRLVDAGVLKARRRGRRVVYTVVHFQGVMDRIRRSRAVHAQSATREVCTDGVSPLCVGVGLRIRTPENLKDALLIVPTRTRTGLSEPGPEGRRCCSPRG